jgi:hypothetical protein
LARQKRLVLGLPVILAVATVFGFGVIDAPIAAARLMWSGPLAHDGAGPSPAHYAAVACARASQCTAVDETGDEVTFDPKGGAVLSTAAVDPGARAVFALTCPSAWQCTAVDLAGNAVTFNPRSPASISSRQLARNRALLGVACPTIRQCTAVDQDRREITFDPGKPGSRRGVSLGIQLGTGITGLACPSVTRCVVVDGGGEVVGFNPRSPGRPKPVQMLNDSAIAVACPSAAECVIASAGGDRFTFTMNPTTVRPTLKRSDVSNARVDTTQPTALACPSLTYCELVDSAGHAIEFDPGGSGATNSSLIAGGGSLSGVACATPAACVAVDSAGDAYSGAGRLPATPVATGRPKVSGVALQGRLLRGTARGWFGVRTSLRLQWVRCSSRGRFCRSIDGANRLSYRLTAADAGHTLRLVEQAANEAGLSHAVASAPTVQVRGLPAAPTVTDLSLTDVVTGRPQLAFDVHASIWGPTLRSVRVWLPTGLSARPVRARAGSLPFEAFGTGSRVGGLWAGSFAVMRGGRGVVLTSDPAAVALRVNLRSELTATHTLVDRARRHLLTEMTLTASVPDSRGRIWRTEVQLVVR